MKLHTRPSTTIASKKRLGRGYGSGKGGHTSSRGQKGQKSRGKVPAYFVGSSWVWFKRLPFIRGKARFNSLKPTVTLTFAHLNSFKAGSVVDRNSLYKQGIISKSEFTRAKLKLVNTGKIEKKLKVNLPATASAIQTIKKLGGTYSDQAE